MCRARRIQLLSIQPSTSRNPRRHAACALLQPVHLTHGKSRSAGNTPAVARSSYIDPRVFDRFRSGLTIGTALEDGLALTDGPPPPEQGPYADGVESAVLELIDSRDGAPALGGELLAA